MNGNYEVTEGYVAIGGEIYKVDAQAIAFSDTNQANYYIVPKVALQGPRLIQNPPSTESVQQIRKGELIVSESVPENSVNLEGGLATSLSFVEQITQFPNGKISSLEASWNSYGVSVDVDGQSGVNGASARTKQIGKTLFYHFELEATLPATNTIVLSLPASIQRLNSLFKTIQSAWVNDGSSVYQVPVYCNADVYPDNLITIVGPFDVGAYKIHGDWVFEGA